MRFSADARLAIGTLADLSGELTRLDGGFAATLDSLRIRQQGVAATLTAPATVTLQSGTVELTPLGLDFGTRQPDGPGPHRRQSFDIDVAMRDPAARHRQRHPPRPRPRRHRQRHRARHRAARARPTCASTYPPPASSRPRPAAPACRRSRSKPPAPPRTAAWRCAPASRRTGLAATANGTVPLGTGDLALDIDLQSFPLALVDRVAGNRGLRGTVTGTGRATGPLADPAVTFDLRGEGITADVLASNEVPPFALTAAGSYRALALELSAARATAPGGLDLQGSGRIPFAGPGLDASFTGSLPLAFANPLLATRSAQAAGEIRVTATARGSLAAPQLAGTVALSGGSVFDPETNIRLQNISLDARLDGNAAVLRELPRRGGQRRHHHRPGPRRLRAPASPPT